MARRQKINPFYPLLVISGTTFAVTAFAYGVMALKAMSPSTVDRGHPLLMFLDHYGMPLMAVELAMLTISSLLAMGTDGYWSGQRPSDNATSSSPQSADHSGQTK